MEQEQILTTLTEQLGQTSLSPRTLSTYISENLPEEGKEFNFDKHVKILKSLGGQYSHDVAEQVTIQTNEFKKNWKPETPKPAEPPKNEGNDEISQRIAALENEFKESKRINRDNSLRSKISSLSGSLKVANENLWRDCVNSLKIEENDNEETLTAKAKARYEKKLNEYFGQGAAPYGGASGNTTPPVNSKEAEQRRNDFKQRMKSRGRL